MLILLFLMSSAQADWSRIQSSGPIRTDKNMLVATYQHSGAIDPSIKTSQFLFYMTLVYDLSQSPSKIYSRLAFTDKQSNINHHMAEEWLINQYVVKPKMTSTKKEMEQGYVTQDDDCCSSMGIEEG